MAQRTHYHVLNIRPTATQNEIQAAYRTLVRQYHPDVRGSSESSMRELNLAYSILSNQRRRRDYDAALAVTDPQDTIPARVDTTTNTQEKGKRTMSETRRVGDIGKMDEVPTFNQLGILVLDGSGSMSDPAVGNISKAQAVNSAVREMFTRFSVSRYKKNFSFAVVTFDEDAAIHTAVIPATDVDDNADYDPMRGHGGGTSIGSGLRKAREVAEKFLQESSNHIDSSVVIVVMSDGRDGEAGVANPADTRKIAEEIKNNNKITICAAYFAKVGLTDTDAQNHLRDLASNAATGYKTVYDADTLRKFFIATVSAGSNVTIERL